MCIRDRLEGEEPARLDAVVVRDEDLRTGRPVVERSRRRAECARATAGGTAGDRLAALLVEISPLGPGALAGHVRLVVRRGHVVATICRPAFVVLLAVLSVVALLVVALS